MAGFVTHGGRCFINLIVHASLSAYLGHTTVVCQSLGLIGDLTALERNVFDLEGIMHQEAVSTFCLSPQMSLSVHLDPSPQRPQAFQCCHLPHLLLFHLLYALLHFPFICILSSQPNLHAFPPPLQSSSARAREGFLVGSPDGVLARQPVLGP